MLKRMFLMLAVMLIVIAALGFVKFQPSAQGAAFQPPPAAVTTIVAAQRSSGRRHCAPSARWLRCRG